MMKDYFCLIPKEQLKKEPGNTGWRYAKEHKTEWVDASSIFPENIPNCNYNPGINFFVKGDKVYDIVKMYASMDDNATVHICYEVENASDVIE